MLLSRRRRAQKRPKTDPSYGMIRGEDESDEMFSGWSEANTELPHFSFSLEAWRGFVELGPVWQELGARCDDSKHPGQSVVMSYSRPYCCCCCCPCC